MAEPDETNRFHDTNLQNNLSKGGPLHFGQGNRYSSKFA